LNAVEQDFEARTNPLDETVDVYQVDTLVGFRILTLVTKIYIFWDIMP
jgi:hypothetical protein